MKLARRSIEARALAKSKPLELTYQGLDQVLRLFVITGDDEAKLKELSRSLGIPQKLNTNAKVLNTLIKAIISRDRYYASTLTCVIRSPSAKRLII